MGKRIVPVSDSCTQAKACQCWQTDGVSQAALLPQAILQNGGVYVEVRFEELARAAVTEDEDIEVMARKLGFRFAQQSDDIGILVRQFQIKEKVF